MARYTDEELEFLIGFLRGTVAFQEERMRRFEQLAVARARFERGPLRQRPQGGLFP